MTNVTRGWGTFCCALLCASVVRAGLSIDVVARRSFFQKNEELARAEDKISPQLFLDPPTETRPGCFWAWLNGSITSERLGGHEKGRHARRRNMGCGRTCRPR
jgi:hypothetical protein